MIELPLVALGGVLGSSHCIGMCGGFALSIGLGAPSWSRNLARQLVYSTGRVFTYGFLGLAAGFAGFWFAQRSGTLIHAQAILSIVAGLLLVAQGLGATGLLPRHLWHANSSGAPPCLFGSFLGPFLHSPRWESVFMAGVINGLLPCGLVYGYLALASSTASLLMGLLTMIAFGVGTVPVMALTGSGATLVSFAARRRLFRVAGVCVLLTGLLAITRGLSFWGFGGSAPHCPNCEPNSDSLLTTGILFVRSLLF